MFIKSEQKLEISWTIYTYMLGLVIALGQVHIEPSAYAIVLWSCKGIPLTLFKPTPQQEV